MLYNRYLHENNNNKIAQTEEQVTQAFQSDLVLLFGLVWFGFEGWGAVGSSLFSPGCSGTYYVDQTGHS